MFGGHKLDAFVKEIMNCFFGFPQRKELTKIKIRTSDHLQYCGNDSEVAGMVKIIFRCHYVRVRARVLRRLRDYSQTIVAAYVKVPIMDTKRN